MMGFFVLFWVAYAYAIALCEVELTDEVHCTQFPEPT